MEQTDAKQQQAAKAAKDARTRQAQQGGARSVDRGAEAGSALGGGSGADREAGGKGAGQDAERTSAAAEEREEQRAQAEDDLEHVDDLFESLAPSRPAPAETGPPAATAASETDRETQDLLREAADTVRDARESGAWYAAKEKEERERGPKGGESPKRPAAGATAATGGPGASRGSGHGRGKRSGSQGASGSADSATVASSAVDVPMRQTVGPCWARCDAEERKSTGSTFHGCMWKCLRPVAKRYSTPVRTCLATCEHKPSLEEYAPCVRSCVDMESPYARDEEDSNRMRSQ